MRYTHFPLCTVQLLHSAQGNGLKLLSANLYDIILSLNSVTQQLQSHWCSARTLVPVAFGGLRLDVPASLEESALT